MMTAPDPNKFPRPRWATYVPDRTPNFKQHSSLGLAKTAISTRNYTRGLSRRIKDDAGRTQVHYPVEGGFIYEFTDDKWQLVATIEYGSFVQDHPLWQKAPKKYTITELP